jgi:beta-phosphoglucomutase
MLKAVIFDFDGIIVDSEPLHYQAFQRLLEPLGAGYSWKEYVDCYMGFDDREAFSEACRANGLTLDDGRLSNLIAAKAVVFQEVIAQGISPYPGVVALIRSLAGTVPLALCSGALRSDIEPVLRQLSLTAAFDCIVTAEEVLASKPDPASYVLALKRLQEAFPEKIITPADAVAIEDTPAGISSALGAGLHVLAVTNSYPAEKLGSASKVVSSLAETDLAFLQQMVSCPITR